jgi:hypothetical protein
MYIFKAVLALTKNRFFYDLHPSTLHNRSKKFPEPFFIYPFFDS